MRVGAGPSAGAAGSPFGSYGDAGYRAPAAPWQSSGADPGYGAAAGFGSRPGQPAPAGAPRSPATGPQPALGVTPPEETPPPWAGLVLDNPRTPDTPGTPDTLRTPDTPGTPQLPAPPAGGTAPWPDQADPLGTARPADPAPAAPRRTRGGQHAARHGKPSRRSRGGDS